MYGLSAAVLAVVEGCTPAVIVISSTDAGSGRETQADVVQDIGDAQHAIDVAPPADRILFDSSAADSAQTFDSDDLGLGDRPDVLDIQATADTMMGLDAADVVSSVDTLQIADVGDGFSPGDAALCPDGMLYIPGGTFLMGDTDSSTFGAQPAHLVALSPYCIDATEVTAAAFQRCTSSACGTFRTSSGCNQSADRALHPMNCLTWEQANAYCRWRNAALPTEAQWEFAARGTDGRRYVWGNSDPVDQLCWSGSVMRTSTCLAGSLTTDNSFWGVFDMAGNVAEWTADWYAPYTSASIVTDPSGPSTGMFRVQRGVSWAHRTPRDVRAAGRAWNAPMYFDNLIGFRCARGPRGRE